VVTGTSVSTGSGVGSTGVLVVAGTVSAAVPDAVSGGATTPLVAGARPDEVVDTVVPSGTDGPDCGVADPEPQAETSTSAPSAAVASRARVAPETRRPTVFRTSMAPACQSSQRIRPPTCIHRRTPGGNAYVKQFRSNQEDP
jgi:hypothetical protein